MPRRREDGDADLSFRLDPAARGGYFSPGDVVTGRVVRHAHMVATRAWVTVQLCGRTKVLLQERRGNHREVWRARHNFWGQETSQTIFDGPMHVPSGGPALEIPFVVAIPMNANPQHVARDNKAEAAFTSLAANDVRAAPLPPTFYATGVSGFECYVEYYLQAYLKDEHGGGSSSRVFHRVPQATMPIRVLTPSSPSPVVDFCLQRRAFSETFRTPRLVPGMELVEPSFRDKARSFFHSSKVPHMGVQLRVQVPAVLQQSHPSPFPFLVHAVRDAGKTSPDVAGSPQHVHVVAMSLALRSYVDVVVPTSFRKRTCHSSKTVHLGPSHHELREPVTLTVADVDHDDSTQPVDIGAALGLALDAHGRFSSAGLVWDLGGSAAGRLLAPSFKTFSIRQSFELLWHLRVRCAGETAKFHGLEKVRVLAPPQQGAAPPLKGVLPPRAARETPPPEFHAEGVETEATEKEREAQAEVEEDEEAVPPYEP